MSRIHYFQRYDSKENWVTNSTLLLLSRLYQYNRIKFERVINTILEENKLALSIGVVFRQQEKGSLSVVDGVIEQDSFKIAIETKLYDNFTADQLERHLDVLLKNSGKKILLALSRNKVTDNVRTEIIQVLQNEKYKAIEFASTTYSTIIETIRETLSDYEVEMIDVLEDYILLCKEHGLIETDKHTLLAVTANTSLRENIKYGIYYDPVSRSHNLSFKYLGLYFNKSIVAVGKVMKVVICNYEDGKLVAADQMSLDLSPEEYERVKNTIEQTEYYNLQTNNKFYLVDKFYPTDFRKTSVYSLRQKRYFFLQNMQGYDESMTTEQLADLLRSQTWQ
jgi:hypothetical protein